MLSEKLLNCRKVKNVRGRGQSANAEAATSLHRAERLRVRIRNRLKRLIRILCQVIQCVFYKFITFLCIILTSILHINTHHLFLTTSLIIFGFYNLYFQMSL